MHSSTKVYSMESTATTSNREITPEERMKLKTTLIGEHCERALAFQTLATKRLGPAEGIMMRQLVFWEGASMLEDGWLVKRRRELHERAGLREGQ